MVEFVQDDDRLREERKKAKKNKDKYIGVSSDSMGSGFKCEWAQEGTGQVVRGQSCTVVADVLLSLSLWQGTFVQGNGYDHLLVWV